MSQHYKIKLGSFLVASTLSSMSYASGFAIIEQSVTGLGRAFAGSAAVADDASTIFFNPAGLTNLPDAELDIALNYIAPQSQFKDDGSTSPFGAAAKGNNGADAANNAIVPNLYYSQPINDRLIFGLGINAPFGLVTEYNDTWKGRYHAVKSDLKTVNINPTLAYKASDKLSLGFGINLQKIDLELTQMAFLGAPGDAKINIKGDDLSWGYNLGLTYQIQEATRIGVAYRSKISHHITANADITTQTAAAQTTANGAGLINTKISGDVVLPESLSFAIHHQLNNQWAVMGDASWTRWSRFKDLTLVTPDTAHPLNKSQPENWSNVMRYGLGLSYAHNDQWIFRGGIAYDETPISDEFRTPRIPGNDRKWVSVGASYKYSQNVTLDMGYSHLFVNNPKIDDVASSLGNPTITGEYEGSIDLLGLQMRWIFL